MSKYVVVLLCHSQSFMLTIVYISVTLELIIIGVIGEYYLSCLLLSFVIFSWARQKKMLLWIEFVGFSCVSGICETSWPVVLVFSHMFFLCVYCSMWAAVFWYWVVQLTSYWYVIFPHLKPHPAPPPSTPFPSSLLTHRLDYSVFSPYFSYIKIINREKTLIGNDSHYMYNVHFI